MTSFIRFILLLFHCIQATHQGKVYVGCCKGHWWSPCTHCFSSCAILDPCYLLHILVFSNAPSFQCWSSYSKWLQHRLLLVWSQAWQSELRQLLWVQYSLHPTYWYCHSFSFSWLLLGNTVFHRMFFHCNCWISCFILLGTRRNIGKHLDPGKDCCYKIRCRFSEDFHLLDQAGTIFLWLMFGVTLRCSMISLFVPWCLPWSACCAIVLDLWLLAHWLYPSLSGCDLYLRHFAAGWNSLIPPTIAGLGRQLHPHLSAAWGALIGPWNQWIEMLISW